MLTVAAEASYWQRHCYNHISRAWRSAVHSQVYSLSVPACVHHRPSSSHGFMFHWVQASVPHFGLLTLQLWCFCELQRVRKKGVTPYLPLTLPNADRFSKFFHW